MYPICSLFAICSFALGGTVRICPPVSCLEFVSILVRQSDPDHCGCGSRRPTLLTRRCERPLAKQQETVMDFQKVEMRALSDDQLDATSGGGLPLRADAKAAPSQSSQGGQI